MWPNISEIQVSAAGYYFNLFSGNRNQYKEIMLKCISNGKRFCKERILPEFHDEFVKTINLQEE